VTMTKAILLPPLHRKRGNPNWGKPIPHVPATATEFEKRMRELQLTRETSAATINFTCIKGIIDASIQGSIHGPSLSAA
jgi:hypothetical protein